jgi:predicted  nucleic acid-binding Zn-ribbon protein
MRDAVIAARAALAVMRDQIGATERELDAERRQLMDAERRGRLAGEIGDQETVQVAQHFAAKHASRVNVLERKLGALRDELTLAEHELADMTEQLKAAGQNRGTAEAADHVAAAQAGMGPAAEEDERLKSRMDREAREAAAEQQLEALKQKMGKRGRP